MSTEIPSRQATELGRRDSPWAGVGEEATYPGECVPGPGHHRHHCREHGEAAVGGGQRLPRGPTRVETDRPSTRQVDPRGR
jgi:hypothetical protein